MAPHSLQLEWEGALRYLLKPPAASAGAAAPVLVFLHGFDEGAPMPIEAALTRHGPLRPARLHVLESFVVIAPQLPVRGDVWAEQADAVGSAVRRIHREMGGDPERTYLTGFSFGGNGVFDLAIALPRCWAALWAVDPTRAPRVDPARPVWVSAGEIARSRRTSFITGLRLQHEGERVWRDRGEGHVESATAAYRGDHVYEWLLTHTLSTQV